MQSHPTRGAWIEIESFGTVKNTVTGRTPHGVRGLKFFHHPGGCGSYHVRRTPHGVRGLKWDYLAAVEEDNEGRTPHGVRGLKLRCVQLGHIGGQSHPTRGAWIEMWSVEDLRRFAAGRTPHGVRGLK